jgi:hypothetical protein
MGYERRKFVNSLDDKSIKLILENAASAKAESDQLSQRLRHELERLISKGYLDKAKVSRVSKQKLHDAFICHSSNDKRFARRVANDLESHGFKVWFDEFEMLPGDSLYEKIQNGIRTSAWFIIVLSPHSVESKWCKRELHNAMEEEFERNKVYVVPIYYKECVIPGFLKEKVWADFQGKKYKIGLHQLLKRLSEK